MRFLFLMLLPSLFSLSARAAFDMAAVNAIAKDPQVKTVEDFISRTPVSMRSNNLFTLGYHPHGLIPGSPQYPTALLFGDSSSQVEIVFSTKDTAPDTAEDAVEILAFKPELKKFETARIAFKKDQNPSIEYHPQACVRCHGENTKPLWRSGYVWEGFFGSRGDTMESNFLTNLNYTPPIDERKTLDQLRSLSGARLKLFDLATFANSSATGYHLTLSNIRLAEKLGIEQTYAIANKIVRQPHSDHQIAQLLAALALCQDTNPHWRDQMLAQFGVTPKDWYMNVESLPNEGSPTSAYRAKNESFEFGQGPIDYLLISQILQLLPSFDRSDFQVAVDDGDPAPFDKVLFGFSPDLYLGPALMRIGVTANPPRKWCDDFLAKH